MDVPDQSQAPAHRACPDCGAAVADGQRRCTNCGTSVDTRRRLPRRTPLIAALSVAALSGLGVVVAQAAVTEDAGIDAAAPADVASAPVTVEGPPLPAPAGPTYTPPKVEEPEPPAAAPTLNIPALDPETLQAAADAAEAAGNDANQQDGEPVPEDTTPDPDDLQDAKKIKVKKARNYDPQQRVGVEFGKPKAAIDKRSRTVWDVNIPADGDPFNVGIVLDLGDEAKKVSELKISTPTPKFGAVIFRADSKELPKDVESEDWKPVSVIEKVSDDMTVPMSLDGDSKWTRYILVYLTTTIGPDETRAAISNLEVLP